MNQEQLKQWNRRAAAEGIVLLKNEENMLPIKKEERLAVYSKTANLNTHTIKEIVFN